MRINSIRLHNFRNIEDTSFDFLDQVALIIGNNDKGKSSLLEGVRLAISTFMLGLDEPARYHIQEEDVRRVELAKRFVPQKNTFFEVQGIVSGKVIKWKRTLARENGRTDYKDATSMIDIATNSNNQINVEGKDGIDLPVLWYFGTGRLWSKNRIIRFKKKNSKLKYGYEGSLAINNGRLAALAWIKANYYLGLKNGKDENSMLLDSVLESISICIPNLTNLEWDLDYDDLAGQYKQDDGATTYITLNYLIDGLRSMTAMVAEIAYRCAVLNDHLVRNAVKQSKGVVLIDEIDMHIHPNWQKKVIGNLKVAFPNIQFILTSQSPFIVQSVSDKELINLETAIATNPNTLGLEIGAKDIMGVESSHSDYYQSYCEKATKYLSLLSNIKEDEKSSTIAKVKKELAQIETDFQADPAYAAFLKLNLLAKLGK